MDVTSEIGMPLLRLHPKKKRRNTEYLMASHYKESLFDALLNDKKFRFGIMVKGYDTSLPADEVESVLRTHFSSCGEITHVYISTPNNRANRRSFGAGSSWK